MCAHEEKGRVECGEEGRMEVERRGGWRVERRGGWRGGEGGGWRGGEGGGWRGGEGGKVTVKKTEQDERVEGGVKSRIEEWQRRVHGENMGWRCGEEREEGRNSTQR